MQKQSAKRKYRGNGHWEISYYKDFMHQQVKDHVLYGAYSAWWRFFNFI
jgi:hypothetical protein